MDAFDGWCIPMVRAGCHLMQCSFGTAEGTVGARLKIRFFTPSLEFFFAPNMLLVGTVDMLLVFVGSLPRPHSMHLWIY